MDLDPIEDQYEDYGCQLVSYDGHKGNDFGILDFVEQDEGRYVLAAADGVVSEAASGAFDEQTEPGSGGGNNGVHIIHTDGTETRYYHLKKWSTPVYPGQFVREGQPIGMVGSSGGSTGPHLHFEIRNAGVSYEPHSGYCRLGEPLWNNQEIHAFDCGFDLALAGMTTVSPARPAYLHRPPEVHHVLQSGATTHYTWTRQVYAHPGDHVRVTYRRPDGGAHFDEVRFHTVPLMLSGRVYETQLPATGHLGTWSIEVYLNDVLKREMNFVYDAVPYENPVGEERTVAVTNGFARGELRGSDADSGIKEFRIVTPPAHGWASLHGPRNREFTYTPESGYEGTDTFEFEVVDGQDQVSTPATMTFQVSPVVTNCLRLEDDGDYISVPDNGSLNAVEALTLEAWVRRRLGSSYGETLIDRRYAGNNSTGYFLSIDKYSRLRLGVGNGTAFITVLSDRRIPLFEWVHVAGVWDGAMLRLYINGEPESATTSFGGPIAYPGTYDTTLGKRGAGGYGLRADVEEMRIWSVARTAGELRQGKECAFLGGSPPSTLLARWPFQGDATDASGHGNHGAIFAPASFVYTLTGHRFDCSGLDSDADGLTDDLDNCSLVPNTGQADADGDGMGDPCDLCPALAPASQWDSDEDGVGDGCDLCPFHADSEQVDSDADGAGDACDPEPGSTAIGVPAGDIQLTLSHNVSAGRTSLSWGAEPVSAHYEVYRGTREEVRDRFYGVCQNWRDPDTTDTTFAEDDIPAGGESFAYLVVGVSAAETRGLAGLDSAGRQRDLTAKDCLTGAP